MTAGGRAAVPIRAEGPARDVGPTGRGIAGPPTRPDRPARLPARLETQPAAAPAGRF